MDTVAPETFITRGPEPSTAEREALFEYASDEPAVGYECSLDGGAAG